MAKAIKVALAGAGAFGIRHLDGIKNIDGVEVVSLVGRRLEPTKEVAGKYGIKHEAADRALAVIFCNPPNPFRFGPPSREIEPHLPE